MEQPRTANSEPPKFSAQTWNFGGADGALSKTCRHFGLKDVFVADNDCGEDDWKGVWTEGRFDLVEEDGGEDLSNDDYDKQDDDNFDDGGGGNTSRHVSIIDLESLMFPFWIR